MDLKVVLDDGTEHTVPITYAVACAWEDHHPGQAPQAMFDPIKFKQIAYLAYEALRKNKITVKVWPSFIDTVADVEILPKGRQEQRSTTST
ncbi:MAG: hypothetical protein ACO3FT_08065 [Ilumatobacteraceae bacterium]